MRDGRSIPEEKISLFERIQTGQKIEARDVQGISLGEYNKVLKYLLSQDCDNEQDPSVLQRRETISLLLKNIPLSNAYDHPWLASIQSAVDYGNIWYLEVHVLKKPTPSSSMLDKCLKGAMSSQEKKASNTLEYLLLTKMDENAKAAWLKKSIDDGTFHSAQASIKTVILKLVEDKMQNPSFAPIRQAFYKDEETLKLLAKAKDSFSGTMTIGKYYLSRIPRGNDENDFSKFREFFMEVSLTRVDKEKKPLINDKEFIDILTLVLRKCNPEQVMEFVRAAIDINELKERPDLVKQLIRLVCDENQASLFQYVLPALEKDVLPLAKDMLRILDDRKKRRPEENSSVLHNQVERLVAQYEREKARQQAEQKALKEKRTNPVILAIEKTVSLPPDEAKKILNAALKEFDHVGDNALNDRLQTPLMVAVRCQNPVAIEWLFSLVKYDKAFKGKFKQPRNLRVDMTNDCEQSVLDYIVTAKSKNPAILKILMDHFCEWPGRKGSHFEQGEFFRSQLRLNREHVLKWIVEAKDSKLLSSFLELNDNDFCLTIKDYTASYRYTLQFLKSVLNNIEKFHSKDTECFTQMSDSLQRECNKLINLYTSLLNKKINKIDYDIDREAQKFSKETKDFISSLGGIRGVVEFHFSEEEKEENRGGTFSPSAPPAEQHEAGKIEQIKIIKVENIAPVHPTAVPVAPPLPREEEAASEGSKILSNIAEPSPPLKEEDPVEEIEGFSPPRTPSSPRQKEIVDAVVDNREKRVISNQDEDKEQSEPGSPVAQDDKQDNEPGSSPDISSPSPLQAHTIFSSFAREENKSQEEFDPQQYLAPLLLLQEIMKKDPKLKQTTPGILKVFINEITQPYPGQQELKEVRETADRLFPYKKPEL